VATANDKSFFSGHAINRERVRSRRNYISIAVIILALLIWIASTRHQTTTQRLVFPSPDALLFTTLNQWYDILKYSLTTWYRVIVGLGIGTFVGFSIGLLMTWSKAIDSILDPFVELIRPIPPIALTPFFILWFGLGDLGQLLLISLGCFMIAVVTTFVSVRNVSPVYVRASKSLGANDLDLYLTVFIPAILPNLLSGMRVAAATGFGLTVAAEYLGAQGGLGYLIRNARTILQTEVILLSAILLGMESLLTDRFLRFAFGKLTGWAPKSTEA
jgi:ABC-type nitrate/sulfonate/bicarbonate transport system permease component